jgi:hypothetical protein
VYGEAGQRRDRGENNNQIRKGKIKNNQIIITTMGLYLSQKIWY